MFDFFRIYIFSNQQTKYQVCHLVFIRFIDTQVLYHLLGGNILKSRGGKRMNNGRTSSHTIPNTAAAHPLLN